MNDIAEVKDPKGKKRLFFIGGLLLLLFILFLIGFLPRISNNKKVNALAKEKSLPVVQTEIIKRNEKPIELILPSSAQSWHFTPIWSRVNGYLVRYLVDIGDYVKAGDLLAEIDTPETDEQLAAAQADLLNSTFQRDIAKITSDRWNMLYSKNQEAVSKQEVDQYTSNFKSAEALVLMNEKNVSKYTYLQQFKYIYAPFDGVITERSVDIGALIYGSLNGIPQQLFQLAETNVTRFFVDVPQTNFREIYEGLEAEVRVLEIQGKVFKGKVSRFAKALDPLARTLSTEIDVENEEGLLYPGLYGEVKFFLPPSENNFVIPTTALIITSGLPSVATIDQENKIRLKTVQIGKDFGNQVEIIAGLQEGDQIVTSPNAGIKEGKNVELAEAVKNGGKTDIKN